MVFYICSTFILFAQPGTDDNGSDLEGPDAPAAPIDDYVWGLALIGLFFVFHRIMGNVKKDVCD